MHVSQSTPSHTAHAAPPRSNNPLFEALVCETHHAAAMTAIVASTIHAAVAERLPLERAAADRFLPPESAVLLSLSRRSLLEVEPLTETQDVVDGFFLALRVLRRHLGTYFFDAGELGQHRALVIHGQRLSMAASASCHEAFRAVRALESETPGRLPELYSDHASELCRLLLSSERGEMPCIDASGQPYLPALPQRRRSMRRSLGQMCRILHRKAILSGFAKDISESGIGLLRVPFLVTDDVVTVELANGRRFRGAVIWCRGEAAGLKFDAPLAANDPMLAIS